MARRNQLDKSGFRFRAVFEIDIGAASLLDLVAGGSMRLTRGPKGAQSLEMLSVLQRAFGIHAMATFQLGAGGPSQRVDAIYAFYLCSADNGCMLNSLSLAHTTYPIYPARPISPVFTKYPTAEDHP
jgi:hypothetical protein